MEKENSKLHRRFIGTVVSKAMAKTAVVLVERAVRHRRYLKGFKISKRFKIHDEKNACQLGDRVLFQECRPLSREKRWRLVKILNKK